MCRQGYWSSVVWNLRRARQPNNGSQRGRASVHSLVTGNVRYEFRIDSPFPVLKAWLLQANMFAVKGLFQIASEGVKVVSSSVFGRTNEDVRNTDADAQLFDPVLSDSTEVVDNTSQSLESTPLLLSTTNNDRTGNIVDQQAPSLTSEYMNVEHSSRILWLFLLHALIYYALAVIGFSYMVQSWTIINSLYYGTVLFCTIGFGDIEPDNSAARLYTIFLALYGIAFLGILLGAVIDYCIDYRYASSEQHRRKVGTQVLRRMQQTEMMRRDDADVEAVVDEIADEAASTSTECTSEKSLWDEILALILLEIPVLSFVILLAIGVGHFEGWSIFNSIYWLVISGTTVGFGDFYPRNIYVKLFCVFYLPMAVAVLGDFLGRIVTIYMDRKRRRLEKEFLSQSLTLVDLSTMDTDHDGRVDKAEFLSYMLCALQKVSKEDVDAILDLFFKLDVDGSGCLTKSDLISRDWEDVFRTSIEKSMPKRVRNSH
jgi:potassium channel subfamily K, other eukaryote